MGVPSGNFSSANSGRLQVVFAADYTTNAGHDFSSDTLDLRLRCKVGSGGDLQTGIISINNHSCVIERDYTGGSGNVAVAMEELDHTFSGPSSVTAFNLSIACYLIKR